MDEVCDGELQNCKFNGGAYTREHFFGKYPETLDLVKDLSDDDIMYLNRGGHDLIRYTRPTQLPAKRQSGRLQSSP